MPVVLFALLGAALVLVVTAYSLLADSWRERAWQQMADPAGLGIEMILGRAAGMRIRVFGTYRGRELRLLVHRHYAHGVESDEDGYIPTNIIRESTTRIRLHLNNPGQIQLTLEDRGRSFQ